MRAGCGRSGSFPMWSSSSAPFGGGRKQRGHGATQGLQAVELDLLSRPRALHHPGQLSGVVLPDANDEGRVLAKMLCRLHAVPPLVVTHARSLVAVVQGRPCPKRVRQRDKSRERYGILSNASCRNPGGALKPVAGLKLTLLGGFQAQLEAGAALVLPTRKAQALLAYMALPPGQAHPREKLATLLWGDMQDAQARGNLRLALSRIRKALPRGVRHGLVLDGPSVALDPAVVEVDVARFERLVADGRPAALEQIAGLYRGDLLAGLALAERPFEEWLTSERERLHELAIQGLGRLLAHQQKAGAAEPAVQPGLRLLALDPLQEPVHRAVMRLYARLGRREAALRQYQHCVDALKRELSTQPEAETTQLHQQILRSRVPRPDRAAASGSDRAAPLPGPIADLLSDATVAQPDSPPPTNLPAPTSDLIGRPPALAAVLERLAPHRLATLIGAGGVRPTPPCRGGRRGAAPAVPRRAWGATPPPP